MSASRTALLSTLIIVGAILFIAINVMINSRGTYEPPEARSDHDRIIIPNRPPIIIERDEQTPTLVEPAADPSLSLSSNPSSAATIPKTPEAKKEYPAVRLHMLELGPDAAFVEGMLGPKSVTIPAHATDAELTQFVRAVYADCRELEAANHRFAERGYKIDDAGNRTLDQEEWKRENDIALRCIQNAWQVADAIWPGREEPCRLLPFNQPKPGG